MRRKQTYKQKIESSSCYERTMHNRIVFFFVVIRSVYVSVRFHPRVTGVAFVEKRAFSLHRLQFHIPRMLTTIFVHRISSFFSLQFQRSIHVRFFCISHLKTMLCFYIVDYCFIFFAIAAALSCSKLIFSSVDSVMVCFLCKYSMLTKFVLDLFSVWFNRRCCCVGISIFFFCFLALVGRHATALFAHSHGAFFAQLKAKYRIYSLYVRAVFELCDFFSRVSRLHVLFVCDRLSLVFTFAKTDVP